MTARAPFLRAHYTPTAPLSDRHVVILEGVPDDDEARREARAVCATDRAGDHREPVDLWRRGDLVWIVTRPTPRRRVSFLDALRGRLAVVPGLAIADLDTVMGDAVMLAAGFGLFILALCALALLLGESWRD